MSQLHPLSPRRKTRQIMVGKVAVGGDAPITVQSMTKTDTRDVEATVAQIYSYAASGCEIVRVSVPTKKLLMPFLKFVLARLFLLSPTYILITD